MTEKLVIHGPMRFFIGSTLMAIAVLMVLASEDIGWGVAATTLVPACFLAFPALSLMKRKTLRLRDKQLEIETGWLWRRCHSVRLEALSLEIIPMAGLWAVVLRFEQRSIPAAVWISKRRAEEVAAFLDQIAPEQQWPRIAFERAAWDR